MGLAVMMLALPLSMVLPWPGASGVVWAMDRVVMPVTNPRGDMIGRLVLTDVQGGGVRLDPLINGLPPGDHALVVARAPACDVQGSSPTLVNPVTDSAYHDVTENGRMRVQDREVAVSAANRRTAFLTRLAAEKPVVRDGEPMPMVRPYSAIDSELALGNLPDLIVDHYGAATRVSYAPKITVAQLFGRALHIQYRSVDGARVSLGCGAVGYPSRP
ncbi:MAG: hypothetical protein AAF213_01620 [Pseudomonadota bacterium]